MVAGVYGPDARHGSGLPGVEGGGNRPCHPMTEGKAVLRICPGGEGEQKAKHGKKRQAEHGGLQQERGVHYTMTPGAFQGKVPDAPAGMDGRHAPLSGSAGGSECFFSQAMAGGLCLLCGFALFDDFL